MKILVVDDHVLIREALRGVLAELTHEVTILEAPDSRRAMQCVEENADLALVLLDLNLPDRNGFEVLAELRERHPAIAVVMLSASNDRADIAKSLKHGALGFIPKSTERAVMLGALRLVFEGGIYVPPEILEPPIEGTAAAASEGAASERLTPGSAALSTTLRWSGRRGSPPCAIRRGCDPRARRRAGR